MKEGANGIYRCPFELEGEEAKEELYSTSVLVKEMHATMNTFAQNALQNSKYLAKLEKLDALDGALPAVNALAAVISGKNSSEGKHTTIIALTLSVVIIGLTVVVVFLLTGEHSGWIRPLHGQIEKGAAS